ncbi:MAG: Spy/CpxP family protein refolding chaperone [Gemmatimonadota bacterium]|nr:Spy/CpxP family protein refolding chaperone [Gemmatimonadota bacterium]
MQASRLMAVAAGALVFAACDRAPTTPDQLQASLDAVDPVVVTFGATQGLPGGPFGDRNGPPFMGGMPFGGAPAAAADARGPGAPLPDSLRLTEAQKAQIQALVAAFVAANAADLATMKAAHDAARDAIKAGATRDEVRAILEAAKPAADRVRAAAEALRTAIAAVLTPAQRAWIDAHKPDRPPRTP